MTRIHPTAVVAAGARIAEDVDIGPYCCIGPAVEIEAGCLLQAHVVIDGHTRLGAGTQVHPFASLGQPPQYAGFKRQSSGLDIGRNNVIREYVTMNGGTSAEGVATKIGDNGFFMTGVHVAHDCRIGDNVVMANNATLAGHVTLGDFVIVGGLTAVHQFCRIGKHAMVGGCTAVGKDIVPFAIAAGNRARLRGLNVVGMRRRQFSRADIQALRNAYRLIFLGAGAFTDRVDTVAEQFRDNAVVMDLVTFITADATRPICTVTADTDE
jgi:UDP-N-acetylglucosamine acyltransferase